MARTQPHVDAQICILANICGYRQTACESKPMLSANALSQPLLTSGDVMYTLTAVYAVQYTQR